MTTQEAIRWYREELLYLDAAPGLNGDPPAHIVREWERQKAAHRLAIRALEAFCPEEVSDHAQA